MAEVPSPCSAVPFRILAAACGLYLTLAGCMPVPVSTVPLHPRQERPAAAETPEAENYGSFSSPAFDAGGTRLAVYDSGRDAIRIFAIPELTEIRSMTPARRPRRLSFSPGSRYLIIEAWQGWIEDTLKGRGKNFSSHIDVNAPEAILDNIQRVQIWDLLSGQTIPDLRCDSEAITRPQGGWLWASDWVITPGFRSSPLLEAHFTADETEFCTLCGDGVRQRWDSRTWKRLEDIKAPPFWAALTSLATVEWMANDNPASVAPDGQTVILRMRDKHFGFPTIALWDTRNDQFRHIMEECASRLLPDQALSRDRGRIAVVCNSGIGHAVRVWDLGSDREYFLEGNDFGFVAGLPVITRGGVALSPDGSHLAVALLGQMEALLPNILMVPAGVERSDLRLWNVDQGKELACVAIDEQVGRISYFAGVDVLFSPDSKLLAVAGRKLRIYRVEDLAGTH